MNVLIIGFGNVGKHYFDLLSKNKKVKKIFVCNDKKLPNNKRYIQIPFNLKKIKEAKIDSAIICTPSNLHFKFSRILALNSINLLIEKPFVLQIKHAYNLIKISNKKKIKCWVSFQNRCNLAIQKTKKIIKRKKLGKVFMVNCNLFWKRDFKYYKVSWRGNYKSDGGVLSNQAIHLLDAVIYMFGKINKFNGIVKFYKKKLEAEDLISLNFEHKNGIITNFKATTRADTNYSSSMDIIGEKGRVMIDGISLNNFITLTSNIMRTDKKHSEKFGTGSGPKGAMGNGHKKVLREFLDPKIYKSSYELEISKNLHCLEIIHSVYNLSKSNKLEKIKNKQSKLGI